MIRRRSRGDSTGPRRSQRFIERRRDNAADDSVLGTATSAADGTFSITVNAGGAGINGYLKATTPGAGQNAYKDSYLYPPATLTANDSGVPVSVLKVSTYDLVNGIFVLNNARGRAQYMTAWAP